MKRLVLSIAGVFFLAALLIAGMSFSSEAAAPVIIGSISPLTGTNAVQGLDMKRGGTDGLRGDQRRWGN